MIRTTVFSTKQVVCASLGSVKPQHCVASRDNVLFDTKRRYKEAVNDVLCRHDQFDLCPEWHMQLVDFTLTGRMFKLPHPLLTDNRDLHRFFRHPVLSEKDRCAPNKHAHGDHKWNDRPKGFERE